MSFEPWTPADSAAQQRTLDEAATRVTARDAILAERDYLNLHAFLSHGLDGVASGTVPRERLFGALAVVLRAVDVGDVADARAWLERGRILLTRTPAPGGSEVRGAGIARSSTERDV